MNFSARHSTTDDVSIVMVRGDLDAATTPPLQDILDAAICRAHHVVVDTSQVTFMDCAALGVLVGAARRARTRGGHFSLAKPSTAVRHLLDVFDMHPTLGEHDTPHAQHVRDACCAV